MKFKKYFLIAAFMLTWMFSAWAQTPVADMGIAVKEPISIYEQYQSESHQRMNLYEKKMDVFYTKLSSEKDHVRIKNEDKLIDLERKAASLLMRIEGYKPSERNDWLTFKYTTTNAIDEFVKEVERLLIEK